MKEITGNKNYWAILCYGGVGDPLICGVHCSKKEAIEANEEIKDCPAKHKIKRCKVKITIV